METLARRGYRFIAPVAPRRTAQLDHLANADAPSVLPSPETRASTSDRRLLILAIAVVICAVALVAYWVVPRPGPTTQAGRRLTLAVLPFDNLTGDADQEYLSDGLTEEMMTQLGRLEPDRLRVLARSSTWKYKRADRDIGRFRQEFGADYVLEGSLRRAGERVNRMLHPELRQRLRLAGARPEAGAPQEPLGLLLAERSMVLRHDAHRLILSLEGK